MAERIPGYPTPALSKGYYHSGQKIFESQCFVGLWKEDFMIFNEYEFSFT